MDDCGNQLKKNEGQETRTQKEIDEEWMEKLNDANRTYRKCVAGKCPLPLNTLNTVKKQTKFASSKRCDKKLSIVWKESGRSRRLRILEQELNELNTKIGVASGKTYMDERDKNFKGIVDNIEAMELMDMQIKKAKNEISHLNSQIDRMKQKEDELSCETESEGEMSRKLLTSADRTFHLEDQFQIHWRKANRQLEIFEGRVQVSRQRESLLITENHKLRGLMNDMLVDRNIFKSYWDKNVSKLKNRRKILLDMIERASQAFSKGADRLDSLKTLQSRHDADRTYQIMEMVKMERKIDANHIMSLFLGGKGKKREMAPLEAREITRRNNFKDDYSTRLNMYKGIIDHIKKFTGIDDIQDCVKSYKRQENEGFQFFAFLNELSQQILNSTIKCSKLSADVSLMKEYNRWYLESSDKRIEELNKQLRDEINTTLKMKDDRERHEEEFGKYFDTVMTIMKTLRCDFSSVQMLLGDHKKITVCNVSEFFSLLEYRLNEVLANVYCDQRENDADILKEDEGLVVKSVKRLQEERVMIEDIITTQQCAECAKGKDNEQATVYPLDHDTIKANMREAVEKGQIAKSLHNLSKCKLPHSGVIANRRFAE